MATPFATPRARALGFGLRACRTDRDLGVRELARLIGVLPQELSNWEYGKRIPKVEQVALLLGVVGEREERLALARSARRSRLTGPEPAGFRAVVSEAVLRPEFIEPAVMVDQLRFLLTLLRRSNVTLQVLRGTPEIHPGLCGPF